MNVQNSGRWSLCCFYAVLCLFFSCTKFDENLHSQDSDSGIIRIVKKGADIKEAQIDETITVYAKIGEPDAPVSFYVSGVEAQIVDRGRGSNIVRPASGGEIIVPMDTFNIVIPKGVRIGLGSIYFSINKVVKPAMSFNVRRPDILFPNKIIIDPFLFTYSDSVARPYGFDYIFPEELKDGLSKTAVVNTAAKLTYDRDGGIFYFLDFQRSDNSQRIRRLKDGMVTTIAGGGDDYFATSGNKVKLSIGDMKPGPDGKLYFTNNFMTDPDPATGLQASYALIQRIDPVSGKVEIIAGNNGRMVEYYFSNPVLNYRGIEDGPEDSAMINSPQALTFDKQGTLYFLDGGELLRRLTKDGGVETVLGKVNRDELEFEDADGKIYKVVLYSTINEHSDGFGNEVRLFGGSNMVQAGNGKFYVLGNGAGWGTNIVEINVETKEASTIVGLPEEHRSDYATGTFKEVGLNTVTTFDVDFDGNILFGFNSIFKMDLQQETITRMTSFKEIPPPFTSERHFMQNPQSGNNCILGRINRIVFDQFGNLYAGYDYTTPAVDVRIVKIIIEK